MKAQHLSNNKSRIHGFDLLRAVVMFSVVIAHSALTYNITNQGPNWPIKDPKSNNQITDLIVYLIHGCAMPIFFVVAGFFGAMLLYERSFSVMVKNRMNRLVYPFIVFMIILGPICKFCFAYTKAAFAGSVQPFNDAAATFESIVDFLPLTTYHLWFLFYLIIFTFVTPIFALNLGSKTNITKPTLHLFNWLLTRPFARLIFFVTITFLTLLVCKESIVHTPMDLIPDLKTIAYYYIFYIFGWLLYKCRENFDHLTRYAWLFTILAVITAFVKAACIQMLGPDKNQNLESPITIAFSALAVWLFTFGVIGLFIKYGRKPSPLIRYFSDSSYWVYLIHLPITLIIPAFIYKLNIPTLGKFAIVATVTSIICFVSYNVLVKNTVIGHFLNGKPSAKKSDS